MESLCPVLNYGVGHNQSDAEYIGFRATVFGQKAQPDFMGNAQYGIVGEMVAVVEVADFDGNGGFKINLFGQVQSDALGGMQNQSSDGRKICHLSIFFI